MVYPIRNIPTALETWEFCVTTYQNKRTHGTKGSPRDSIRWTRDGIYGTLCTPSGSTSARSPVALHIIPSSILPFTSFSVVVPSCLTARQHLIILPFIISWSCGSMSITNSVSMFENEHIFTREKLYVDLFGFNAVFSSTG